MRVLPEPVIRHLARQVGVRRSFFLDNRLADAPRSRCPMTQELTPTAGQPGQPGRRRPPMKTSAPRFRRHERRPILRGAGGAARRRPPGQPGCPAVGVSSWVTGHLDRGASASRLSRKKLRRTPTWRAKCRMGGSGKTLKVRTLGCARSSSPPTDLRPSSLRSRGRTQKTCNTKIQYLYWVGPLL